MSEQGVVMARLRVQELARARNLSMSDIQRDSRLTMNLVRRYWYNTADGKSEGKPLGLISLDALEAIANALKVEPGDLIARSE